MHNKSLKVLEFNKILEKICYYTDNEVTRAKIMNLKPKNSLNDALLELSYTNEAVKMLYKYQNPQSFKISQVYSSIKRSEIGASLSPKELLDIARLLTTSRIIKKYITQSSREETPLLYAITDEIMVLKDLEDRIFLCILSEEEIADAASSELSTIRRKMRQLQNKIKDILDGYIHSSKNTKFLQEPIVTMRSGRYVIPVRSEYRAEVSGIVHDTSRGGATLFIEPMNVVNLNNDIRKLLTEESAEIDRILFELSSMVAEHSSSILKNYEIVCELDFIFCKAKLALDQKAIMPLLNGDGIINLKKARHPLIDADKVVENDIYLGEDFDTLVITGPNTGGKTVTLKTIGLFCLMAAAGLFIPAAEHSKISVFESVWADIGDEQSIEQSLSTFSSHMKNIVEITQNADKDSLVLFDELGAGTDPVEGAALAVSILEYLRQIGAKTAATTHYSELKLYALSKSCVENASCEFDVKTLKPTYRLLIGVPGKSNAFAISKRLGLSELIINRASNMLSEENLRFEDVIGDIEANRRITEDERQQAQNLKREIEDLKLQIERQKEKLEQNRQKLFDEAKREAKRIINDAKQQAKEAAKQLKELKRNIDETNIDKAVEQIRSKLRDKEKSLEEIKDQTISYTPPNNLIPGQIVEIVNIGQKATVLTKPDNNGNLQVQAGIVKVNVNISNLRLLDDNSLLEGVSFKSTSQYSQRKVSSKTEIDLRGLALDEALYDTDKFLDEAYLSGFAQVNIIHGKGTGKLRSGIQDMLRRHPHVKSFRLGRYGEGESGVTVVELK